MAVTKDEVRNIANLAQLYFDEKQLEKMRKDMDMLVAFADTLLKLDTKDLVPLSHVQGNENIFDEDKIGKKQNLSELLKNAPESVDDYFVVPKVIG